MKMQSVMMVVVVAVLVLGCVEGQWIKKHRRQRGCRRAAGQGVMEVGTGDRFRWTMSGLDDDDLRVTYNEGAFAPEGAGHFFQFPRDGAQRALGIVPAKVMYDFTRPDEPVVVIRQGKRGRGYCIVLRSESGTYDDTMRMLTFSNGTNRDVLEEENTALYVATSTSDDSQFSEVVRRLCSQDQCGRPINAVYFTAEPMDEDDDDSDDDDDDDEEEEEAGLMAEDDDDSPAMFNPTFHLLNRRVLISGLPHPRQHRRFWRRRHQAGHQNRRQRGPGSGRPGPRSQRRQQRQQQRQQRRQQRHGRRVQAYTL